MFDKTLLALARVSKGGRANFRLRVLQLLQVARRALTVLKAIVMVAVVLAPTQVWSTCLGAEAAHPCCCPSTDDPLRPPRDARVAPLCSCPHAHGAPEAQPAPAGAMPAPSPTPIAPVARLEVRTSVAPVGPARLVAAVARAGPSLALLKRSFLI
jgi:hypothetical protein